MLYHSGRLPRSLLHLFRYATSPAMSLLSLTVVSHSRRHPRIPLSYHVWLCRRWCCICCSWGGVGFAGRGGLVDGLFGSGLVVGVCRFCALYLVYLTGLPMLLSLPASCHCDRWFCHSPHAVRSTYTFTASYGFHTDISVPAHSAYTFLRLVRLPHLRIRSCDCAQYPLSVLRYLRSPQPAYRGTFRINRWDRLDRSERRLAPYALYGTIFFC
jgi:hypothetical protein